MSHDIKSHPLTIHIKLFKEINIKVASAVNLKLVFTD